MAQSIAGTNLASNWHSPVAEPVVRVYADWDLDGDYSDADEDISGYVLRVSIAHRLLDAVYGLPVLGGGRVSTASLTLLNPAHRFTPENASGLAGTYASIAQRKAYRVPVKIEMGYRDAVNGAEVLTQFVGQVENADPNERAGQRMLVYTCKGLDGFIERHRIYSTVREDQRVDQLIAHYLTAAGLTAQQLDKAVTTLPFAWANGEPLLDLLRAFAAADGGWLYWDKAGVARYERATHWLESADSLTPQATLTGAVATQQRNEALYRNVFSSVRASYTPMARGPLRVVYTNDDVVEVPPAASTTITCEFTQPCSTVRTPVVQTDYSPASPAGSDMASHCSLTMTATATRAELTVTNSHASIPLYLYRLRIRGYIIAVGDAQEVRAETALTLIDGQRDHEVSNPWLVRPEQAAFVARRMLTLLERPREIVTWTGRLCPWLELGDLVTVQNSAQGLDTTAYVVGLHPSYAGGALRMDAELLPQANVFPGGDYFALGTSKYQTPSDRVYF